MRRSGRLGVWVLCGIGLLIPLFFVLPVRPIGGQALGDEEATPTPTPTTVPFLYPPFAGNYRVTSYFDHHFPDRTWDDTIVIFNGDQASGIDGITGRTPTFRGGYWFPDTFWYIYYDGHNGVDYGTRSGVTILAAAPGEVVFAGSVPSGCATPLEYVCLEHADGYRTFYLHLEGICVREGEWVEAGDPLGISGNSGCSTGPHLHFGVEHVDNYTDPYGWRPEDREDPLIAHVGLPATWLWAPDAPPSPVGKLTYPPRGTKTHGDLFMLLVPEKDSPPIARVEFLAFYGEQWYPLGVDEEGEDGWSFTWDTQEAPEGQVWLHAWAVGADGRVGKGSPIHTDLTVDRHPPQGYIVGLMPGSTVGTHLWLYAASYDPTSTTQQVTFLIRESAGADSTPGEWREIGDAQWLHTSTWLLEWDTVDEADGSGLVDGAQIDIVARLTDGAGNATLTQPVEGITVDRRMPGGQLVNPASGIPFTTTLDLVFSPFVTGDTLAETAPISQVAFYVWHDGDWRSVGIDGDGSDGWSVQWNPAYVADQSRVRLQARVYDVEGRVNTALPQVTDLTLDRTPPSAGYIRPRTGGVAHPDVDQQVWAWDGGSGVDRVEFFVNQGEGWLKIGEDRFGRDGWSTFWEAQQVADGRVDFSARVYDRAGNETWTTDQREVSLDRAPPSGQFSFPSTGLHLSGTVTLTLEITDTVSGLDRAIFYAQHEDRWHHLGADTEPEDGFSLAWDTASLAGCEGVTLTAWVYDRAGNHREVPYVQWLAIDQPISPAEVLTPAASATPSSSPSPTASSTATTAPTPSATPTETPTAPPTPTATATPRQLAAVATPTPPPTLTAMPMPPLASARATVPTSLSASPSVPPAFWYLIGGGVLVAMVLLIVAIRDLRAMR